MMVHWWVLLVHGLQNPIFWSVVDEECGFHWLIAWGSRILPPWRLCPNSLILEDSGGGVLSARLLLHVENPIGKKEEEENKSIENRRSVVLYNHIHLAGRQDRRIMWAFFLAAKLIIIIIIILASPAALEQWGHVTKYVHQVLLARVVSWGRAGGDLHWSLPPSN